MVGYAYQIERNNPMTTIEIIISDDSGTVLSMFDLTESEDVSVITLVDNIKEILSRKYPITEK